MRSLANSPIVISRKVHTCSYTVSVIITTIWLVKMNQQTTMKWKMTFWRGICKRKHKDIDTIKTSTHIDSEEPRMPSPLNTAALKQTLILVEDTFVINDREMAACLQYFRKIRKCFKINFKLNPPLRLTLIEEFL